MVNEGDSDAGDDIENIYLVYSIRRFLQLYKSGNKIQVDTHTKTHTHKTFRRRQKIYDSIIS